MTCNAIKVKLRIIVNCNNLFYYILIDIFKY